MANESQTRPEKVDILTWWDVQSKRIYTTDVVSPTLQAVSGMNIQPIVLYKR